LARFKGRVPGRRLDNLCVDDRQGCVQVGYIRWHVVEAIGNFQLGAVGGRGLGGKGQSIGCVPGPGIDWVDGACFKTTAS